MKTAISSAIVDRITEYSFRPNIGVLEEIEKEEEDLSGTAIFTGECVTVCVFLRVIAFEIERSVCVCERERGYNTTDTKCGKKK